MFNSVIYPLENLNNYNEKKKKLRVLGMFNVHDLNIVSDFLS